LKLHRITFGTNGERKPRATTYQRFTWKTVLKWRRRRRQRRCLPNISLFTIINSSTEQQTNKLNGGMLYE